MNKEEIKMKSMTIYPYEFQKKIIDAQHRIDCESRRRLGLSPLSRSKWLVDKIISSFEIEGVEV